MKKHFSFLFIAFFFSLTAQSQMITTIAGTGVFDCRGDGGPAIDAAFGGAISVAVDMASNIYVVDMGCDKVRRISISGIITTVAGDEDTTYSGDGGPATLAGLHQPTGVAVDRTGNVYIADNLSNCIRKVNTSGIISTIAGTGVGGYNGDNIPATSAQTNAPYDVAVDTLGNVYIVEFGDGRVRKVDTAGIITTVAGNGSFFYYADGLPATAIGLFPVVGVAIDGTGNLYISCNYNTSISRDTADQIYKVNASGVIHKIAGTDQGGYSGDGSPATAALLSYPYKTVVDKTGNLYIADAGNNRIRKIDTSGIITTFAGNGVSSFSGDGGPALNCELYWPSGIAFDAFDNMYIADASNERVRLITKVSMGVNELTGIKTLAVYPNPAAKELTITSTNNISSIVICNLLGQTVCTQTYNAEKVQVDVTGFPTGGLLCQDQWYRSEKVDKVVAIRHEQGLSQKEIAGLLEVTKGFIGQVESLKTPSTYSVNHLNRIAYEFKCSVHDLIPSTPIIESDWDLT